MSVNEERERLEKILEELGPRFCTILTKAEIDHMKKFIDEYEAEKYALAADTLSKLDFIHTVALKICVPKEEK